MSNAERPALYPHRSVPGIGKILRLVLFHEIRDITRCTFDTLLRLAGHATQVGNVPKILPARAPSARFGF
jgi:hypothetical protein